MVLRRTAPIPAPWTPAATRTQAGGARGRQSSAARTASWTAWWTATLAARSVRTRTRRTPGAEQPAQVAERPRARPSAGRGRRPGRPGRRRGACRTAARSASARQRRGLGQEREDAAAVVVDDDDRQVDARVAQAEQAVGVVEEGDVADEQRASAPPMPSADADRGRHHAVDAVGAAVGHAPAARRGARRTTRRRAPASTTSTTSVAPSGRAATSARATAGLGRAVPAEHRVDGRLRQLLGPPPAGPATACRRPGRAASGQRAGTAAVGSATTRRRSRCVGIDPRAVRGRPGPARRRSRASHWASTFEAGGAPRRSTTVGRCAVGEARRGAAGRRTRPPSTGAGAGSPSGGRPAPASRPRRQRVHRRRDRRRRRPATITPRCWSRPAGQRVELGRGRARPAADRLVPRRRPPGRPGGSVAGLAHQRLAERQVEVHRARPRPARIGHGTRRPSDRHVDAIAASGDARVGEPAHGARRTGGLVDGLRRADVPQLGRAVGGAHDQRHPGLVGLDHRRVELGRGGAAGAHDDRRPAGGQAEPEGGNPAERSSWCTCTRSSVARPGPGPAAWSASRGRRRRRRRRPAPTRRPAWRRTWPPPRRAAAERGGRAHRRIVDHDAGRDLVRRRLPVVLHRQAALRGGPRRASPASDDVDGRLPRRSSSTRRRRPAWPRRCVEAYDRKFGGPSRPPAIIDHVTAWPPRTGLEFHLDRAQRANTLRAHRLLWLAEQQGAPGGA